MNIKGIAIRVGVVLAVAVAVGLIGCGGGDKGTTPTDPNDEKPAYTLTTTTDPSIGGKIIRSLEKSLYEPGTNVTLTAEENEGYTFIGWDGDTLSKATSITVTMNGSLEITAKFQPKGGDDSTPPTMYKLTTTADPVAGGIVMVEPYSDQYEAGTEVTLTAVAKTGYTFIGWEGTMSSNDESITVTMNNNLTLVAKFELGSTGGGDDPTLPTMYALITSASPIAGGSVMRSPDQSHYEAGTEVTLTAVAGQGYVFAGWIGASSSMESSITITMDEDKTLTAGFAQPPRPSVVYTLTVNRNPADGGTVTPSTPQPDINDGTAVNISATVASGYSFAGWTVTSGTATIADANALATTVAVSSDVTVTANFQLLEEPTTGGPKKIGDLTWMTENLNVETPDSWCYENSPDNCAKYGRLYTWEAAKSACASLGGGWRLPDTADWRALVTYAGGQNTAGKKLKANSGWRDRSDGTSGNGTDDYGFSAMPGGNRNFDDGGFYGAGYDGIWWSATEADAGLVYGRGMGYDGDGVGEYAGGVQVGMSARCVED